jgi:hypothetical protein
MIRSRLNQVKSSLDKLPYVRHRLRDARANALALEMAVVIRHGSITKENCKRRICDAIMYALYVCMYIHIYIYIFFFRFSCTGASECECFHSPSALEKHPIGRHRDLHRRA